MSLTEKSDEEISSLLTEYGIKHGPIVESTRKLYEKKLEKAMKAGAAVSPSSDKTYYREEEEEVTYITYRSPARNEVGGDTLRQRGNAAEPDEDEGSEEEEEEEEDTVTEAEPPIQMTSRTVNHSAVRSKEPVKQSWGGCMWKLLRLLLLSAVLAAFCYYAYCRVTNNEDPFKIQ